jgi:hypothetical protein
VDTIGSVELFSQGAELRIAAEVLRRFYALFGLGREAIPFLNESGDQFDPDSIEGA